MLKAVFATVMHTGTRSTLRAMSPGVDWIYSRAVYLNGASRGNHVVWAHTTPGEYDILPTLVEAGAPLIHTMRDPMQNVLTTLARNAELDPGEAVGNWLRLHTLTTIASECHRLCIGPGFDLDTQLDAAHSALDFYEGPLPYTQIGKTEPSALVSAYANGDYDYIKASVPEVWDAVTDQEGVLRPWFEDAGYSNLPWWS